MYVIMHNNRIKQFLEALPHERGALDCYWIVGRYLDVPVSRATARAVERQLDRTPTPEWIVFRTLTGARQRVRTAFIERVVESTAEQRAALRAFRRALDKEEQDEREERGWDDGDPS